MKKLLIGIAFLFPLMAYRAVAVMLLWNWFIASPFNWPTMTFGLAMGVLATQHAFRYPRTSEMEIPALADSILESVMNITLVLFMGTIIHYATVLL